MSVCIRGICSVHTRFNFHPLYAWTAVETAYLSSLERAYTMLGLTQTLCSRNAVRTCRKYREETILRVGGLLHKKMLRSTLAKSINRSQTANFWQVILFSMGQGRPKFRAGIAKPWASLLRTVAMKCIGCQSSLTLANVVECFYFCLSE